MSITAEPQSPLVDLRILGPLAVTVGGAPVALGGPRQMAVLARLMLAPGQVVSTDQLVEAVWDGDVPSQPTVAVRSYVSNLRRAIEPDRERRSSGSFLSAASGGYRLDVSSETIDWCRFEALVGDGRSLLEAGEPVRAIGVLRQAGSLWRGEFGAGLPDSEIFFAHRARLDEMRHTAVELLYEAQLAGGDHVSVAAEIEGAIAANPLRERLTELGMLAMYRAGRQSDALGLGRQLRERLIDQLGVDPSPAIVDLEVRILNHDPTLAPPPVGRIVDERAGAPADDPGASPSPFGASGIAPDTAHEPGRAPWRRPAGYDPHRLADQLVSGFASTPGNVIGTARRGDDPVSEVAPDPDRTSTVAIRSGRPFLGRDRELAAMSVVLDEIATGRSATAFVTGEPGAGRTALVTAFERLAADRGVRVFSGRGVEGTTAPLWPFSQLLAELAESGLSGVDALPSDLKQDLILASRLTGGTGEAGGDADLDLDPALDRRDGATVDPDPGADHDAAGVGKQADGPGDPGGDRERHDRAVAAAGVAITRVLRRLAAREPLVLVFDDVQWADPASVSLIELLAASLRDVPVAILATWRASTGHGTITADLHRLELLEPTVRIGLSGIDRASVARMVCDAGFDGTERDVDEVDRASGGNPQLVRALVADRMLGAGTGPGPAMEAAMAAWTDGLPAEHGPILATAAIFGGGFSAEVVAEITGHDVGVVSLALTGAVRTGLVVDPGFDGRDLRFRHRALADAMVGALPPSERAALEGAVGRLLATRADRRSMALEHLARSDRSDDRAEAVGRALDRFDPIVDGPKAEAVEGWARDLLSDPGPGRTDERGEDDSDAPARRRLLESEAMTFLAWRSWLAGRTSEATAEALAALEGAIEAQDWVSADERSPAGRRGADRAVVDDDLVVAAECALERAASAALGRFRYPGCALAALPPPGREHRIGGLDPGDPPASVDDRCAGPLLREAIDRLPSDRALLWQLQVHLLDRADPDGPPVRKGRPSGAGQALLDAARRRLGERVGPVSAVFLERFWTDLARAERSRLVAEVERGAPSVEERVRLLALRLPDMIEQGTMIEVERTARALSAEAAAAAQPYARLGAWIQLQRVLVWRGDVEEAGRLQTDIEARLAELGLTAGPLVRSLERELRRLDTGPEGVDVDPERVDPAEMAAVLAEAGRIDEAAAGLDRLLHRLDPSDPSDPFEQGSLPASGVRPEPALSARIAVAAARTGHEGAGRGVLDDLEAAGDRLIVDPTGGPVLGPSSLYAGLAALAAGKPAYADAFLARAAERARATGGQTALIRALVARLGAGVASEETISLLRVEALTVAEVSGMATAFVAALGSAPDAGTGGRNRRGGRRRQNGSDRGRTGSNQVPTEP